MVTRLFSVSVVFGRAFTGRSRPGGEGADVDDDDEEGVVYVCPVGSDMTVRGG